MKAKGIVDILRLKPHPEGGHYRETFRDSHATGGRSAGTAIYYLLQAGERSHWHKVDAVEIWHYYAGAPLELEISVDGETKHMVTLGTDLIAGERPQAVVPAGAWQAAETLGAFTLVGCTVAPGFEFSGFEMAPSGWRPSRT